MGNQVGVKYDPSKGFYLEVLIEELSAEQVEPTLNSIRGWMKYLGKVQAGETPRVEGLEPKIRRIHQEDGSILEVEESSDIKKPLSDEELEINAIPMSELSGVMIEVKQLIQGRL